MKTTVKSSSMSGIPGLGENPSKEEIFGIVYDAEKLIEIKNNQLNNFIDERDKLSKKGKLTDSIDSQIEQLKNELEILRQYVHEIGNLTVRMNIFFHSYTILEKYQKGILKLNNTNWLNELFAAVV